MTLPQPDPPETKASRGPRHILVMFAVLAIVAVGLGSYALHLKRKVARDAQAAAEQQLIVTPPVNGPPEPVHFVHCQRQRRHLAQDAG